jgi:hypothetical protein
VRHWLGIIGRAVGLLALCVPLAFVVTLLLTPFWRWLEATTGIESIGHSGPADWCFDVVYCLCLAAILGAWWRRRARTRTDGGP